MSRCVALLLLLLLLLLPLIAAPRPATAQGPERVEAFVYGVNAGIPGAVVGTFAPPSVETLYLVSGETSILSARRTLVYFWPITNEYRAAWSQMNESVDGTLEVVRGGSVVASLEEVPYTILFSAGETGPRPSLYLGEEAIAADNRFFAERDAYQRALRDYDDARQAWLDLARQIQAEGGSVATMPPQPEPPPSFNLFSTGLNAGFPLDLAPGRYQIRTRLRDGTLLPESVRALQVVAPRRTAVGYRVIPESQWTIPQELNDLADVILGEPESVLYLQPHVIREYPALAYERLMNPQFPGDVGGAEWRWVLGEPLAEGTLELLRNGQVVDRKAWRPYFVRQVPGAELGYEILPYDPSDVNAPRRSDFVAFRIALDPSMPDYRIRLLSDSGEVLRGSEREVRVNRALSPRLLLLIPLLPLAVGGALLTTRRRQTTHRGPHS